MKTLKPNILEMLEVGKECGLETLSEAYNHYLCHQYLFFNIKNYAEQAANLHYEMMDVGFIEETRPSLIDMKIDKAIQTYQHNLKMT